MNKTDKHIVGILGSGFGLYGYLPAIMSYNHQVVLLSKYRPKLESRAELSGFLPGITWVETIGELYEKVDFLIVCLSPQGQTEHLTEALKHDNIQTLILEKPLSTDPEKSVALLNQVIASDKKYRIGYNFLYTSWGNQLLEYLRGLSPIKVKITWTFMAHHFAKQVQTWKRFDDEGGGSIRFYGIHLLALLSNVELCEPLWSKSKLLEDNETYLWQAGFLINGVHSVDILVDSKADKNQFLITVDEEDGYERQLTMQTDPFDEFIGTAGPQDRRVGVILPVLNSLTRQDEQEEWNALYIKTNDLWSNIEQMNASVNSTLTN